MAKKRTPFAAIGRRVHDLRKARELTQGQLAEFADLTTNYIGKVERGEAQPTVEALLSIARALKANPSELFTYLDTALPKGEIKQKIRELLERL